VPGLAGADRQAGGQVGLAGAGWAEEDHVLLPGDEVQGAQVGDDVALEAAGVVEVELLQGLAGREPGGSDPALTAVGLPGGDLALQARGEELLVGPGLGPGTFGEALDRGRQRWRLEPASSLHHRSSLKKRGRSTLSTRGFDLVLLISGGFWARLYPASGSRIDRRSTASAAGGP
jgi:hypothetical protein